PANATRFPYTTLFRSPAIAVPFDVIGPTTRGLRGLEPRVFRAQRLLAHGRKSHDQLRVVVERLDADDAADAELGVPDAHAGAQVERQRTRLNSSHRTS